MPLISKEVREIRESITHSRTKYARAIKVRECRNECIELRSVSFATALTVVILPVMRERSKRRRTPRLTGASALRHRQVTQVAAGVITTAHRRRAADRVRSDVITICSAQEGLITHAQLARRHGGQTARLGLRWLADRGETDEVMPNVWVHAATARMPLGDLALEAQARWLALAPALLLRERTGRTGRDEIVPVIAGGAAWQHWALGPINWRPEIAVPIGQTRVTTDEIVDVVVEEIDPVDVVWVNQYPYLRPEATLARGYGATVDVAETAAALAEAMWRLHPLRPELLAYHLQEVAERNGWVDEAWNAETIYNELVTRAGGWPTQPGSPFWAAWRPNAAHVRRVRRKHPSWLVDDALIDWWDEYRRDGRE